LYQLRPSDRQALSDADKVFWIGPDMERFLVKPLGLLASGSAVALQQSPGLAQLQEQEHGHHHHGKDPHYWLNPLNAIAMAETITRSLQHRDPSSSAYYENRLLSFREAMTALDQQLNVRFNRMQPKGYLVLHDAYGHFEQPYGLTHKAAVSISPDRKPGAKRLQHIQRLLDSGEISCVFKEPQYQQSALSKIVQQADVTVGVLDPLAIKIAVSPQGYEAFMRDFSQSFYDCVEQK
jgi:zinc transport system substrate-binding protein